jgi:rare lipoprotein A
MNHSTKTFLLTLVMISWTGTSVFKAQTTNPKRNIPKEYPTIQVGTASFYADKFEGKQTSSGEIFSQKKLTGAHNTLPLGMWVKVTRLSNGKSVIVKINDRLHHKNKRLIDLSKAAAKKLGYTSNGLTRVQVEVLGKKRPEQAELK